MKKKFLFMALGVSMLGIMTGNFVKADDEVQEEESIVQPYEHQHRDVGESVYREAGQGICGMEMELRTHLMRSVLRRNAVFGRTPFGSGE